MDRRPLRHGTRHTYKAGCRCLRCRRAEAVFRTELRKIKAKGQRHPGMRVPAAQTKRRLRSLKAEGFSLAELARRLGLQNPQLRLDTERVTVKTEQRIEAFYTAVMAEGPGEP